MNIETVKIIAKIPIQEFQGPPSPKPRFEDLSNLFLIPPKNGNAEFGFGIKSAMNDPLYLSTMLKSRSTGELKLTYID